MDKWCSKKEREQWVRATNYKIPGKSFSSLMFISHLVTNTLLFFSIGRPFHHLLSQCNGLLYCYLRPVRFQEHQQADTTMDWGPCIVGCGIDNRIAPVIEHIGNSESRLAALHILIEFGTPAEKKDRLYQRFGVWPTKQQLLLLQCQRMIVLTPINLFSLHLCTCFNL